LKLFLGICILTSSLSFAADVSSLQVNVRPYNRVFENAKVSLLDVVDRESIDSLTQEQLAAVVLGDAPKMGEQRVYSNTAIADAIRGVSGKKTWSVKIPRQVVVDNRGYQIDQETVEKELLQRWQKACEDCRLRITALRLPAVPEWVQASPWDLPSDERSRLPRGHFSQKLMATGASGQPQIFWINGTLEVTKRVPVLNRSTPLGTRITEEDFTFEWRDVTQATDTTPEAKEIVGQQTKFSMNANDVIWRGSLVREKAVRRGEMVRVITAESGWEVTLQARTEQDGFVGDTVNLKNLQTNKMITGRVTAAGEVEIR
jgi:flagella basal body P-ring formation protein FlgA